MTADYSAEIKIVIFQSVLVRQRDKWRSSSNCGRIAAKIARFNSKTPRLLDGSSPNLDTMSPDYCQWTFWKRIYDRPISCQMSKQRVKVVPRDVDCTTSYVSNSRVLNRISPNFYKVYRNDCRLLKSKLRSSNPFRNATVTNEDCRQIASEFTISRSDRCYKETAPVEFQVSRQITATSPMSHLQEYVLSRNLRALNYRPIVNLYVIDIGTFVKSF